MLYKYMYIAIGTCLAVTTGSYGDTLSLNQYTQIVLKHSPQTQIARSAVSGSIASRSSTMARMLPQVSANAGISRGGQIGVPDTVLGGGAGNSVSAGINANVLVLDFGRTPLQYKAADITVKAAWYDQQTALQTTIVSARSAYLNYLLTCRLLGVSQDARAAAQLHYDQAKELYEVGKQANVSLVNASVDVANAQVSLIQAQNAVKLARVQLETTAGAALPEPLILSDSLGAKEDSLSLSEALSIATTKRPALLSAAAAASAAQTQRRAAAAAFYPSVNANAGFSWRANDNNSLPAPDLGKPDWNVGASLNIPLFQGGANAASLRQADASLERAQAELDLTSQSVTQEVQQHFLEERAAQERIAATGTLVLQAATNLQMTQERFHTGIATSLEITDAELTLAQARSSHFQAQFDYRIAHAKLLLAIGVLNE